MLVGWSPVTDDSREGIAVQECCLQMWKATSQSNGKDGTNAFLVDQVLFGDSSRSWVLGRDAKYVLKKDQELKAPPELVNELKISLREEVRQEVEENLKKKMEAEMHKKMEGEVNKMLDTKMTLMMKQLARYNPSLNIDVDSIASLLADSLSCK
ncbi:uncharacterized protein [Euphorbia lathyris]|uniref:uncharacterized protein n=1 Tax=Euphorbia lathyris TaxID=212925 RepID=UPI003313EA43